jgi:hypothetical protein
MFRPAFGSGFRGNLIQTRFGHSLISQLLRQLTETVVVKDGRSVRPSTRSLSALFAWTPRAAEVLSPSASRRPAHPLGTRRVAGKAIGIRATVARMRPLLRSLRVRAVR